MPKKIKALTSSASGVHEEEIELTDKEAARLEQSKADHQEATADMTRAQQRLERLVKEPQAIVEPFTIEDEEWFPKRLNWEGLTCHEIDRGDNSLGPAGLTRTTASLFYHALATSEHDPASRYFESIQEALAFVRRVEPAVVRQVDALFARLVALNPDAMGKRKN